MSCTPNQDKQIYQAQHDKLIEEAESFYKSGVEKIYKELYPGIDNEEVFSLLSSYKLEDQLKAYALCLNEESYLRGRGLTGGKEIQSCQALIHLCESRIARRILMENGWGSAMVFLYYQKKLEDKRNDKRQGN